MVLATRRAAGEKSFARDKGACDRVQKFSAEPVRKHLPGSAGLVHYFARKDAPRSTLYALIAFDSGCSVPDGARQSELDT
jgi:hypothetical protein